MSDKSKLHLLKRAKSTKRVERESAVRGSLSNLLKKWYQIERLKWFILLVLSLITSILIFPNILSKTKTYHLGDVADLDIKASRDFLIEDKELTEKNMEKAVKYPESKKLSLRDENIIPIFNRCWGRRDASWPTVQKAPRTLQQKRISRSEIDSSAS
jgi:hypothetical protein